MIQFQKSGILRSISLLVNCSQPDALVKMSLGIYEKDLTNTASNLESFSTTLSGAFSTYAAFNFNKPTMIVDQFHSYELVVTSDWCTPAWEVGMNTSWRAINSTLRVTPPYFASDIQGRTVASSKFWRWSSFDVPPSPRAIKAIQLFF